MHIKNSRSNFPFVKVLFLLLAMVSLIYAAIFIIQDKYSLELSNPILFNRLPCKDCNVVVVTLDTLSAEHLPCYDYSRNTAPILCDFAEKNILFENAYSNATWTFPSHLSMFTGLYPSNTGVVNPLEELGDDKIMLPQLLKSVGYNTMLFLPDNKSSFPTDRIYGKLGGSVYSNEDYSWEQSIEMFKQSVRDRKKTFLFLHTYDVHEPFFIGHTKQIYEPAIKDLPVIKNLPTNREDYKNIKITPDLANDVVFKIKNGHLADLNNKVSSEGANVLFQELLNSYPNYEEEVGVLKKIKDSGLLSSYLFEKNYGNFIDIQNPNDIAALIALYDQTINIMDTAKVSLLRDLVNDSEFSNNTIMVILGDHGEEFMKHGALYHVSLYNSNIRVPLIMHVPGVSNKTISKSVQLADIAPTIIDMLNIQKHPIFDGDSLVKNILNISKEEELVVTDGFELKTRSLLLYPWKLHLLRLEDNSYRPIKLYNLDEDPDEYKNVLTENSNIKDDLIQMFQQYSDCKELEKTYKFWKVNKLLEFLKCRLNS